MKIRQGFVSNSSSSSFIVLFPHAPKSAEEVKEILFSDEKLYGSPYSDTMWDTSKVSKTLFEDIQDQGNNVTAIKASNAHRIMANKKLKDPSRI